MNIKNKKTNRIISFLLVFCMIFSMIPNIFATDTITTVFSVEKTYNDNNNYYHSRPHTTEVSIYGTNTENDTENGTLITTTELTWKTLEDNTRLYSAIVEIDTQDYQYYYVEESTESYYDTEWQTETTVTVLTSDSEEYTNIISGLEIEDTTNVKVVKTSLTSTPVEKTYNYNLVNIWNDDNDSREERPNSVEIKIWGAPDEYDTEYGKLLDTFTISSENMIDENTWKIENKQVTTAFPYVFAEASYEGIEEGKYSVVVANGLFIENANNTCDLTITNNYGYYHDISITSYWDDEEIDTHRDDITVNIYGVNNYDDYYNKTNGTLIKTVTITAENTATESRWDKYDTLTLDTKYNWAYAEVSSLMYDNEVYAINGLDCDIYNYINAPRTIDVSFRNDLISKQDVNLTITWDDETANSRPNELILDIYSASRYNETFSDSITINKNDDLNLDGDENTWELSLKDLNTLVDLDYILIEVNTTDTTAPKYYYSASRVEKATDGPTAIAMTATFESYPQVMNLVFNWNDNNNEKGERPESVSFDIYATNTRYSYSDGDYSAYNGELLETVTMTAADVSPVNPNQWLKTLNYTTGYTTLYVLYSSPNTGSEKYIAQIDSEKITSNNPTTYEITMSSTYGYENDFYVNFNWLDNSDAGKVRPDNVKIKIYGTNTEGDTSNGVLLFEDTLNGSDKSLDMIYTSEKYNYYYSEVEIINAETPLGTYTLKDSSYRITEDGVSFTFEISLDREMKLHITKKWEDSTATEGTRPEKITYNIYGREGWNKVLIDTITLTPTDPSANTWEFDTSIYGPYIDLEVEEVFNNKESYLDPVISIERTDSNVVDYDLTTDITADGEIEKEYRVELYINATWEDYENKPEEFSFTLMGTNYLSTYEELSRYGTNIEEYTLTTDDIINSYGNTDTYIITIDNAKYSYYYLYGVTQSSDLIHTIYRQTIMPNTAEHSLDSEVSAQMFVSGAMIEANLEFAKPAEVEYVSFNVESTSTYVERNKVVSFNITKTWDDQNNYFNERPEEITLKLYGTNTKDATSDGELLETITLSANNDLNIDTNDNTWEYKITDLETTYNYFYMTEEYDDSSIEGTYTLTINTIEEYSETESESLMINTQELLNLIQNEDEYAVSPMSSQTYGFTVTKIWDDNNNANGLRPESIIVNVYGNHVNNEERKELIAKIKLSEEDSELLYSSGMLDTYRYLGDETESTDPNIWNFFSSFTDTSIYVWFEEENVELENEAYYAKDISYTAEGEDVEITIINRYIDHPTYNIQLTNTYAPKQRDVQFNIKKVWDDENNKYNFRPESISFRIYGTDVEGATSGGEILDEVVLGDFAQSTTDPNVWEILTGVIETHYDYFYITEIDAGEYYTTTISPINKVEQETLIYTYGDPISTLAGGYYEGFSIDIYKEWDDNDNAAGKRPAFVDFEILRTTTDGWEDFGKIRMYENKTIVLEDPFNKLGLGETENYDSWTIGFTLDYDTDRSYGYNVREIVPSNYIATIEETPMSDHGWESSYAWVVNKYYVETYDVTITNTFENPYKNVQFKLNKIWNDQNNKYNLRPYEVEFKLYGTNIEGATSGGELLKTITLNSSNAINTNTWSIITEEFETIYDYFYIKETSISGNYTTTISPIEKVDSFTTVINNLQNNSGIAPLSGSEDFIYLYKIWDDNNNEKGKRPESITINAYTDEAKTDLYFSLELTETTCTMLEDPHGIDFYSYGGWSAESIFFGSAPNVPELYIEEICDNYVSSIVVSVENSEEFLGTDTNITITNTYTEDPVELYEVNITNTMTAPERDVQFKINKIWNDYLNKYNSRGPVTINIYGTNTEGATTGGSLVGSFTMTEEDFVERNIWSKTSPVFSTSYEYFYLEEVFNGENYTTTISPITKNNKGTNVYSSDPEAALALGDYSIIVKNEWEDTDETKRPEFIDFEILYSENTSASISEMELYAKVRVIDNESYIIEDPLGKFTLGRMIKPAWLRDAWAFDLATTDTDYIFAVKEISPMNYYSEIETEITNDGDWTHSVFTVTNNYYVEEYEATITNTYEAPRTIDFELTKVWNDDNNALGLRPNSIQIEIYGVETEGATTGGTLIHTETLTVDNATDDNTWKKQIEDLATDYEYFYIKEKNIGNDYVSSISPITKKEPITQIEQMFPQEYSVSETAQDEYGIAPAYVSGFYYGFKVRVHKLDEHGNYLPNAKMFITDSDTYYGDMCGGQWTSGESGYFERELYWGNNGGLGDDWISHDMWHIMEEEAPEGYEIITPICIKTSEMEVFKPVVDRFGIDASLGGAGGFQVEQMISEGLIPPSGTYVEDFYVYNTPIQDSYSATITNTCVAVPEVIFNINKTWDDGNNTANLRPQGIQVQIYGTNTEGATSGGTLIDTIVLTNENVNSTNSNVWNKTVVLEANYPYFYAVELSSIGTELSTYTLTSNTVTKVDNTIQPANEEVYNVNLTNKLDSVPLTITKIWKDDNNMYNTRPDSLNITVYQNGRVFDVITFTSANVLGGNNNVWEAVINVPKLDENGNEYVYTISEDENCLELGYYYYEPYINQTSLTAINVGIWLPPLDIDIVPSYSITVGKEIINVEGQLATEADFWRMYLNKNDTYNFPIVLKQLERIIYRGETGMKENYEGYTGVEIHGVLTNKGQIVFTDLEPGKYEISENINQYFDFVSMESILASSGASLTYENGKYYITLSGVTGEHEEITIKVINKLKDERPFNDLEIKENLFKIERDR